MDRKNTTIAVLAVVAVVGVAGAAYFANRVDPQQPIPAVSTPSVSNGAVDSQSSGNGTGAAPQAGNQQDSGNGSIRGDKLFEIRAELVGNAAEVEARTEFVTSSTDRGAIAAEIVRNLKVSRETVANSLRVEVEDQQLSSRIRAEARARDGQTEVKAEVRFVVQSSDRAIIAEESFKRLSALTAGEISSALEFETK